MATGQMNSVIRHVCGIAVGSGYARQTDGQLLESFIARRDEVAFEALVRRHGPMVLGVCRRIVGNDNDADDAFQATFLVLIRRAACVVPREAVGNWLYGVAYRTALEARGTLLRHRAREKQVTAMPEPHVVPEDTCQELVPLLDRELNRLPDKYRLPVVLCELEGQSRTAVAHQLGLPEGTLSSRLATARRMLAKRLGRCGLSITAGGALAAARASSTASPDVSHERPVTTVPTAAMIAAGKAACTGASAAQVAVLAETVIRGMFLAKLKIVTVIVLGLGFLGAGAVWASLQAAAAKPVERTSAPNKAPAQAIPEQPGNEKPAEGVKKPDLNQFWSQGKAEGKGPVKLTNFPLRLEDIDQVLPMGMMVGGHVTPSDHLYIVPKDHPKAKDDLCDVLAVADGFIVQIQRPPAGNPDPSVTRKAGEYRVVFEHSATCWSYLGLINRLDEAVLKQVGKKIEAGPPVSVRIPVKAGQVIGKTDGGHSIDFALVDTQVTLKGFVNPEHFYRRDPWKPYTVDPFGYVEKPLKEQLLALNPRQAEPHAGKIDYDVEGRLIGNWYREKTGGYAGLNKRLDYWVGHLTVAYHHIDPSQIIVSLGDFDGKPRQFAVAGNAPDPAKVSAKDGVVKYDLQYSRTNNHGEQIELARELSGVQGVLLVQVLDGRKLKVEAFKGKSAADVKGFTESAAIYER